MKDVNEERAARTVSEDMFQIRQLPDNTIEIKRYTGDVENIVIPERLFGLTVTVIGANAFQGRQMRSVVIPDTVTEIRDEALSDNRELEWVTIKSRVRIIGRGAFFGNIRLTGITIPDSVIEIASFAFVETGLTSVTLGKGLRTIGEQAFARSRLTSITLPAGLRTIGDQAFLHTQIQSVTIPSGIESVGNCHTVFGRHNPTIIRATLPANLSDAVVERWGFEAGLCNFYASQNRAAGIYVKNGPIWKRQ